MFRTLIFHLRQNIRCDFRLMSASFFIIVRIHFVLYPFRISYQPNQTKPNRTDFVIALVYLALYALFNFSSVLVLLAYAALGYVFYIQYPEDIEIGGTTITASTKKIAMGVGLVIALMCGGLFCLLISVAFFLLVVVGVHASISETES